MVDLNPGGNLLERALPGTSYNNVSIDDVNSLINSGTTDVDVGVAVARGSADQTCKKITADADVIIGISMRSYVEPLLANQNAEPTYPPKATVPVKRHGYVYVVAFEAVTRDTQVVSITAQGGKLGSGSPGAGRVIVPGAFWEYTAAAGAVAGIRMAN